MTRVTNSRSFTIKAAINKWGGPGRTGYFDVKGGGGTRSWRRSDRRGFVMSLEIRGSVTQYYVLPNSEIVVDTDRVTDHGTTIDPVSGPISFQEIQEYAEFETDGAAEEDQEGALATVEAASK